MSRKRTCFGLMMLQLFCIGAMSDVRADSTDVVGPPVVEMPRWGSELRAGLVNQTGGTASVELRYMLVRDLSIDFIGITRFPAGLLGVSVYPLDIFYLQAGLGRVHIDQSTIHGPTFSPDYGYMFRGGIRVGIGDRWTASLGAGALFAVDPSYCWNCDRGTPPGILDWPASRSETRRFDLWEVGVGLRW